jgi:tripartite ATP-independent transporter DctM subunit
MYLYQEDDVVEGIIAFIICLIIGIPIAFSLGISSVIMLLGNNIPMIIIAQRMFTGIDSFPFMAIPFFILAGELMNKCEITSKLVKFSDLFVGHIRGGLSHINIVASMFFAGITGSAVADTSAIGSMLIPAMHEKGFDDDFSAAVTAASSVVGPIIPPSIPMVVFALLSGQSVAALFLGGLLPGILLGIALLVPSYLISVKKGYPRREEKILFKYFIISCFQAIVPLMMPLIILGGILTGIFTATEASAIAVVYSLVIGFFVYRNLKVKDLYGIFVETAKTTGIVFLVIASANIFNWLLSVEQVPQLMASILKAHVHSQIMFLMMLNIVLLFLGTFIEGTAAMIITVPLFLPIAIAYGVHPVMFGVITVLNLMIGLITPPVGLCLYVACGIAKISLEKISKAVIPFLIAEIATLFIVTYWPFLTLGLPRILGYIK